jgi:starvation-inducible outer membrane lipoprotein
MNRIIATALLLTFAVSGCASLPDSIKGPFAHSGSTATDADRDHAEVSPYPKQSPFGN